MEQADDTDPDSDMAPHPPPCRKPCCWADRADPNSHRGNKQQQSHDFLADYQDNIPDHNKCIVDLSEAALSAQRASTATREENSSQSVHRRDSSSLQPSHSSNNVIDITDQDDTQSHTSQLHTSSNQLPQISHTYQSPRKSQSFTTPSFSSPTRTSSTERKHSTPSASISHPSQSQSSASKAASVSGISYTMSDGQGRHQEITTSHFVQSVASHPEPVPIALHAAGSDRPGQIMLPPEVGVQNPSSTELQMVHDIKKELDLSDIQFVSGKCTVQIHLFYKTTLSFACRVFFVFICPSLKVSNLDCKFMFWLLTLH